MKGNKRAKNSEKQWRKVLRGEARTAYKYYHRYMSSMDKKESQHRCRNLTLS